MVYLIGGLALITALGYLAGLFMTGRIATLVRVLRYGLGWGAIGLGGILILGGRTGLGAMLGLAGASILSRGRLGPIDFGAGSPRAQNTSKVKSRYFEMELDHDSGTIGGTVREGPFARADLEDLDAEQSWALYQTAASDPDSRALFETWLDAHREGWREHFAREYGFEDGGENTDSDGDSAHDQAQQRGQGRDPLAEAYDILGLAPGASADEIRSAHRALMKKVHPDHGGSSYLAARINEAKDRLLDALGKKSA